MWSRSSNSSEYTYGFNGQKKDDEIKGENNSYDFGARIYDPRIGRFLSLDPRMNEFSFWSPYIFASNTPIQAIDDNGEGPVFKNKDEAERVAADINAIFRDVFEIDYDVIKVTTEKRVEGYLWWAKEYDVYTFEVNNNFDWNSDIYTKAFYNFTEMEEDVPSSLNTEWDPSRGSSEGSEIEVSANATDYSEDSSPKNWTIGGIYLHEALYHISTLGISEYYSVEKIDPSKAKDTPNIFRRIYKLRTGIPHGPQARITGIGWGDNAIYLSPEEKEKLKEDREKTGKKDAQNNMRNE